MAIEDKIKWDKKYTAKPELLQDRSPSKKLEKVIQYTDGKKALEVACGSGRNSLYLAQNGFRVDAYDISQIALETLANKNHPNILTQCVDLDSFKPLQNSYDLIIMTNFLDRKLIPNLLQSLAPKGILFVETYMDHPTNTKPDSNPDFLLQTKELKNFIIEGFKIIEYDEFDNEPYELYRMKKQSITIQKD